MIYLVKNNQRAGPYSEEEVRRRISNGELALTDLGWRDGLPSWISLCELLGLKAPPPLPSALTSSVRSSRAVGSRTTILIFVVSGLGLLGAYFDISVGRAIYAKIQSGYSDFDSFVDSLSEFWRLMFSVAAMFMPASWRAEGEHVLHAARTAANILIVCGVAGGLTAVLFWLRRHVKILASVLMLSGIAPLMFDTKPFGFVGLPMAFAGFLGLFVRNKESALPKKVRVSSIS